MSEVSISIGNTEEITTLYGIMDSTSSKVWCSIWEELKETNSIIDIID